MNGQRWGNGGSLLTSNKQNVKSAIKLRYKVQRYSSIIPHVLAYLICNGIKG